MESQDRRGPADYVGYEIIRRADKLSSRFTQALRPHGLTSRQFSALAVIDSGTTRTNADLARAIVMTPQSVGTLLDVLSERGLIERAGRSQISLSDAGRAVLREAYSTVDRLDKEVRAILGEDYEHLARILGKWM